MISKEQMEYLNYWKLFKGNYAKGVHALESLLGNPAHRSELFNNVNAMSVIFYRPAEGEDGNSAQLRQALKNAGVEKEAITTFLSKVSGKSTLDAALNDVAALKAISKNESAAFALVSNKNLFSRIYKNRGLEPLLENNGFVKAISYDVKYMEFILSNDFFMQVLSRNLETSKIIIESKPLVNFMFADKSWLQQLSLNSNFMNAIASNHYAFQQLLNLKDRKDYECFLSSDVALDAIASSSVAAYELSVDLRQWGSSLFYTQKFVNKIKNNSTFLNVLLERVSVTQANIVENLIAKSQEGMNAFARNKKAINQVITNGGSSWANYINESQYNNEEFASIIKQTFSKRQKLWEFSTTGSSGQTSSLNRYDGGVLLLEGTGEYLSHDNIFINNNGQYSYEEKYKITSNRHRIHFGYYRRPDGSTNPNYVSRKEDSSGASSYILYRLD